jgi:hypothetical protein
VSIALSIPEALDPWQALAEWSAVDEARGTAPVGFVWQDALNISRQDGETVNEALTRAWSQGGK